MQLERESVAFAREQARRKLRWQLFAIEPQLELQAAKRLQKVGGRVERHQPPRLEHADAAAQQLGLFEVMRGEHDSVPVVVQAPYETPKPLAQFDVDARGGLIEHDHRGLVHQRLRHQHATLHAAGQGSHVGAGFGRQVEMVHHLVDPVAVGAQPEIAGLELERLAHREERVEHQLLRHHSQHAPRAAVIVDHVGTHDLHAARAGSRQPGDDADQRGLAGPVRPEQSEDLPGFDGERHAGERLKRAVALLDIPDLDGVHDRNRGTLRFPRYPVPNRVDT
jgi:hypothetical protein